MNKKLKTGAIVCVGTVVAAVFVRGVKAIIDDINADVDFFDDYEDDFSDDDFFDDDEGLSEDGETAESHIDSAHTNFTKTDDTVPVDKNAEEASEKTVSSSNL